MYFFGKSFVMSVPIKVVVLLLLLLLLFIEMVTFSTSRHNYLIYNVLECHTLKLTFCSHIMYKMQFTPIIIIIVISL